MHHRDIVETLCGFVYLNVKSPLVSRSLDLDFHLETGGSQHLGDTISESVMTLDAMAFTNTLLQMQVKKKGVYWQQRRPKRKEPFMKERKKRKERLQNMKMKSSLTT